jgi:Secretion system C-terminal sorting domain
LTWATVNKENNKGFQIERLTTDDRWDVLGFIAAKGKSASYDFTDNTPPSVRGESVSYRLRQIDNDGKEVFSQVLSASNPQNNKLKIYPNPVSSLLTIENISESSFQILNLFGQQVLMGKTGQRLDVSALPQGTYILKVGAEQAKFMKQ